MRKLGHDGITDFCNHWNVYRMRYGIGKRSVNES